MKPEPKKTSAALIQALEKSAADARDALETTTDEHLSTTWQLKARGEVVQEAPRYQMIQDTINHWAHHRGQMTVYLRLMGAKVPAIPNPDSGSNRPSFSDGAYSSSCQIEMPAPQRTTATYDKMSSV